MDTLLPLLYLKHGDLGVAIDVAVNMVKDSIANFEEASRVLLAKYSHDENTHRDLQKFVHACQCACTANLNWRSVEQIHPRSALANI